ncbi:hypothetical protein, partial [Methylobacterium sp. J-068]|uniref:hypothetical protein n=1 Tax=Methylobacterium sp. J-068 TaxID=2836649 RepID=UPI001FBBBAF8
MRGAVPALLPLAAAILAIGVAFATGFDQRTPLPPVLEARFYGFFLDRYPLFGIAIIYGLARLAVVILRPSPAGWPRRLIGGVLALALFLAACLYPTFGGVTLRLAFASGGSAFLAQQPMLGAYALGSGLAALLYAATLGLGALLIGNGARVRRRWLRRLGAMLVRTLALWFALAVLGLAPLAGFGIWPRRAMTTADALLAMALACAAFLPHLL